ncbi:MAG: type II-A CRISPR-associated protein Csn2 [Anaerolineaceae bacterium]
MKLMHNLLENEILSEAQPLAVWVIENEKFCFDSVKSLLQQCQGEDGPYVLTENGKLANISKSLAFTPSPFSIDHNPRRALTGLYKQLNTSLAQSDTASKVQDLLEQISDILRESLLDVEGDLELPNLPDWEGVWKFFNIQFRESYTNLAEEICDFTRAARQFLGFQVFIFVGILAYINPADLAALAKQLAYDQIQLVLIENYLPEEKHLMGMQVLTVDRDLCEVK